MDIKKSSIGKFFTTDIWEYNLKELDCLKSFCIKQLRVFVLAIQGFVSDNCQLRASALTFYSLFSIVPVAALLFAIAKGFGYEEKLKNQLLERFAEHQIVLEKIFVFADSTLKDTKSGMIAGIGVVLLFWTVIKVIGNIESSFNYIWGVKTHRSLFRKFSDYMSLLLILPVMTIMAGSSSVLLSTMFSRFSSNISFLKTLNSPLTYLSVNLIPFLLAWALFTFIYKVMPNTKVKFKSALFAGIVAGTMYQCMQIFYIVAQVALSKYNTIYGSFSALPLFMIWLQISWLIVLLGAEASFAHQNIETYEFEPHALKISYDFRKKLTLLITTLIIKSFEREEKPLSDVEIAHICGVPIRQTRDILFDLLTAEIIVRVVDEDSSVNGYQPAVPADKITIQYVLQKVESCGNSNYPFPHTDNFGRLLKHFSALEKMIEKSPENKLLKDI
ncbi:MAG: YihY/virulence factor BrkB family protein [Victivallaceae bacterium]